MKKEKFITVMAVFDDKTQGLMEELQNDLERCYGTDTKTKGIPFHITLGSYPVEQTKVIVSRIKETAEGTESFEVRFTGLNHFGNLVRYLEPECSENLLELHRSFDSDYANGFNEWKPHVTVYRHAVSTEIELSADLDCKVKEMTTGRIVAIELGEFFPAKHIIRVSLER